MIITTTRQDCASHFHGGIVLALLILPFCLRPATAGELSEVPAAQPPMFSLPDLVGQSHSLGEFDGQGAAGEFLGELVQALHRGDAEHRATSGCDDGRALCDSRCKRRRSGATGACVS